MRLGRRRTNHPPRPVDELGLRSWLDGSDAATQASVVASLVLAIRPFGRLSSDVVDPAVLDRHLDEVLGTLAHPLQPATTSALAELEGLPAINADEEPDGLAFFALGAAIAVLYAARFVRGDRSYATQILSRVAAMVGFADDDLGTKVYPDLVESLGQHAASASSTPIDAEIVTRIDQQASRLSESAP